MKKRLLSILLALCIVLSLLPGTAWAAVVDSGTDGDLTWTLTDNGILTISGIGKMADYFSYSTPLYSQRDAITAIVIDSGVTSVGNHAFPYCDSLTSVSIPDSVTSIGADAFSFCYSLTSVSIPNSVTSIGYNAFQVCRNLTSVTIPNSVTSIGSSAFYACSSLTSVIIPDSVTSIGSNAFGACRSLTSINVGSRNTAFISVDGILFNADQTLIHTYPAGKSNQSYNIPTSVTTIGDYAFYACSNLTSVNIPGSVTSIGDYALYYTGLTSVTIPNNVTSIEVGTFNNCENLKSVFIPNGVTTIRQWAFYNCDSLTDVYYGGSESQWKQISIDSTKYPGDGENGNAPLLNATIHYNGKGPDIPDSSVDSIPLMSPKSGYFKHKSHITKEIEEYPYYYDESWFLSDSTTYNHDLATMSLCMAMAAYDTKDSSNRAANIEDLFNQLKFTDKSIVFETPGTDTIGYAIGSKTVSSGVDTFTLIAVAIRGGGYGQEWASNFTLGTTSEHAGFANAANTVVSAVKSYIQDLGVSQNIKIWITGYSRAAATANIAAQRLNSNANSNSIRGLSKESIYAYCFECPQTVQTSSPAYSNYGSNNNIFNIVNYIDIVTKVAPSKWDYSRYGITYYLPSEEQTSKYSDAHKKMMIAYADILRIAGVEPVDLKVLQFADHSIGQGAFFDKTVDKLASYFWNQSVYAAGHQDVMRKIGRKIGTGGVDDIASMLVDALVEEFPAFFALHPFITTNLLSNVFNLSHAHYAELCLAWMNALDGKSDFVDSRTRQLKINCPVDIKVYDSKGILVAQIIDDTVIEIEDSTIAAYVDEDDQKVIVLPVDEEYTVQLVTTDDGTVTYTATEYNIDTADTERVVSYFEVDVVRGDELTGTVDKLNGGASSEYPLYLNNSGKSLEPTIDQRDDKVIEYDIIVAVSGNGAVSGGGSYVSGEFAKVTAEANSGETFLGWYVDGELVSEEMEYRFLVDDDIGDNYEITARFTTNTIRFTDVSESDWFYNGVTYVAQNGLMQGVGGGKFNPSGTTSRGMIATILYRLEGEPTVSQSTFTDVAAGQWYTDAVAWAAANKIVEGYGNNTFGPNDDITREQMATILYRYAVYRSYDVSGLADLSGYTDTETISSWAVTAMRWANSQGLITGRTTTTLVPKGTATRAEAAVILARFCQDVSGLD